MINKTKDPDWGSILKDKGDAKELAAAGTFISKLMGVQQSATISHRYQKDMKLATHLALEDYYDALDGLLDDLTETIMGYYGKRLNLTVTAELIDNPTTFFRDVVTFIEKNRNFCDESFVQNQIDEIMQITSKLLYKLTFITD